MTTLIGIKAEKGREGVVLASDISATQTGWIPQGDVAYRQQRRSEVQKIYLSRNKSFAVCMTGVIDDTYNAFLQAALEREEDVEKAIKAGFSEDLLKMTVSRWNGKMHDDRLNSFLIASRYGGEPRLHNCWPYGRITSINDAIALGSGSQEATNYISQSGKLVPRQISISEAVDLAAQSLEHASKDIYTSGLDIVVVTKDGIEEFGADIKRGINRARRKVVKTIMDKYSK